MVEQENIRYMTNCNALLKSLKVVAIATTKIILRRPTELKFKTIP